MSMKFLVKLLIEYKYIFFVKKTVIQFFPLYLKKKKKKRDS